MPAPTRHLWRNVVGYRVLIRDAAGVKVYTYDLRKRSFSGKQVLFGENAMRAAFQLADKLADTEYPRTDGYTSHVEEIRE